ncbi:MAG: hypothetical protein J6T54_00630 [Fibrobacter sp.]|nr:hypothetical protein [Fibrobacter sp.]
MKKIFALLSLLALLAACGDESSSSAPDPIGEISSSSNDDNGFSGKDKDASSSSQKDSKKSSSSAAEKKSSSSVSGKNSSSSVVESSSSELIFHRCDDGDTSSSEGGGYMYYFICKDNEWEVYRKVRLDSLDSLATIEKNKEHPNLDSLFAGYSGEYLEFEDPRDGHKYKYIKFKGYTDDAGSNASFYVMAENLNYGKMVPLGTAKFNDAVTEKLCYENDEWFCDNHFGGLYTWAEAMNLPKVCDSVAVQSNDACKAYADSARTDERARKIIWQGICPDGWHVMNKREWLYTRGDIRSKAVWEKGAGENGTGLAIIPAGVAYLKDGFVRIRDFSKIWQAVEADSSNAWSVNMTDIWDDRDILGKKSEKDAFLSVRCVMDANNSLTEN